MMDSSRLPKRRQTFQEMSDMIALSRNPEDDTNSSTQKFMSRTSAWVPGSDLTTLFGTVGTVGKGKALSKVHTSVFGGHVYVGSALAACKAMRNYEEEKAGKIRPQSLHTIHGTFTLPGLPDRPFIYTASPLSLTRSFSTVLVTAAQPSVPSTNLDPLGTPFPITDASLPLASESCFQATVSFKTPEPTQRHEQESSPRKRFSDILSLRDPKDWPPAPNVDIAGVLEVLPGARDIEGSFPAVEMRKVDMNAYNEGKPLHERREIILYRIPEPMPEDAGLEEHALVHAYECDRNGLLMLGNHLGFGRALGGVATLAWTYVIHGNLDESKIKPGDDQWWIQEACFPRAGAGRGIVMSKIWSPNGVHVATEYQDGMVRGWNKDGKL